MLVVEGEAPPHLPDGVDRVRRRDAQLDKRRRCDDGARGARDIAAQRGAQRLLVRRPRADQPWQSGEARRAHQRQQFADQD